MQTEQKNQTEQPHQKPSIFVCKNCKQTEVKIEKKPRLADDTITTVKLEPAKNTHQDQKYIVKVGNKTVGFGFKTMSDFTINKSEDRRMAYISRHQKRESQYWNPKDKDNLYTSSFWARYLLWEKTDIEEAIKHIEDIADIKIKYTKNTIINHQKKLAKAVKKSGEDLDQD